MIRKSAVDFVNSFKPYFNRIPKCNIFNTDQSGYTLELISGRTLEIKGTQKVEGVMVSGYSRTHSYTIQPMISASGDLISPLFVILQEKDGKFGINVEATMFKHKSIFVVPSTSGKITKEILKIWFENIYYPNSDFNSVLLVDSLTIYKDRNEIDKIKPSNVNYNFEIMPAGTTSLIQPLDVYFNRQYKAFVRKISDYILFEYPEIKLYSRDTILQIQTLSYNQFSSPRFKNFIKYSWYKSGYVNEKIEHITPNRFCFRGYMNICAICSKVSFIRCSWCAFNFCFRHFFIVEEYHFCENFIPCN